MERTRKYPRGKMKEAKKIQLQNLRLDSRYKKFKKDAGKEYNSLKKFIDDAKREQDIKPATERKYIDSFSMVLKHIKKPINKLSKKELLDLKEDLKNGKIKSRWNKPYSLNSQREMELIVSRYLEDKYPKIKDWFVVNSIKKTPEILKEEEVEKLFNACENTEDRFLIAVLFDAGCRIGEFINIRFEDIEEPTQSFPYYKINFKDEYSKTEGRNIGVYWKHSTKAIRDYLNGVSGNAKDPVFTKNYDAIRIWLTRLGKRILKKRIHAHLFRKASATYYASKLNRQQLCIRYGWKFSSDMPDKYIKRAGVMEDEVKEKVIHSSLEKLETENEEMKTKYNMVNEELTETRKDWAKTIRAIVNNDLKQLEEIAVKIENV